MYKIIYKNQIIFLYPKWIFDALNIKLFEFNFPTAMNSIVLLPNNYTLSVGQTHYSLILSPRTNNIYSQFFNIVLYYLC
jgi:hypothetical protein